MLTRTLCLEVMACITLGLDKNRRCLAILAYNVLQRHGDAFEGMFPLCNHVDFVIYGSWVGQRGVRRLKAKAGWMG